jgi:hypothetical protein
MTTKQQFITQAREANTKPLFLNANGTLIELTDEEYEASIVAWAEMRVEQDAAEAEAAELLATKKAAYAKLGLTEEEITALIGE